VRDRDEDRQKPDDDTENLVERAVHGDQEAISALYHLYERQLRSAVNDKLGTKLRGQMDTVDLIQSVWKDVLADIDDFEYQGPESFFRWLLTRLIRKIQTKARYFTRGKRDLKKLKRIPTADSSDHGISMPPSRDFSPSEAAIDRERLEKLSAILDTFPPIQREVLILRMRDEKEYEEIGRLIGKSADSTRKLFGRSLEKLIDLMRREAPDQDTR
jgi:RNA polymerase sigma-70 factor (ECF subfamily)